MKEQQQRDILFEACKKIATNRACPPWVEKIIREAVISAKNVNDDTFTGFNDTTVVEPLKIGDVCKSNIPKDVCVYEIIKEHDPLLGVRLFTVKIISGDINNPVGIEVPNVSEKVLIRVK